MADAQFTLGGVADLQARLLRLAQTFPQAVGRALYAEMQVERTESMRRTPVDTGALKGSHALSGPNISAGGADISVTLTVGGVAAPYAVYVHENLEAWHNPGQAKFLESTILESAPYMAARIARRLHLSGMNF